MNRVLPSFAKILPFRCVAPFVTQVSTLEEKCAELADAVSRERELRSGDPEQAIRNAEYLKNVVYKYVA